MDSVSTLASTLASILAFVTGYGDLVLGAILLYVAASVLPGRMKGYVLTAGFAIFAYQAYLRWSGNRKLKELDAEAAKLKTRADGLESQRTELESKVAELDGQLAKNRAALAAANQQAEAVAQRSAAAVGEATRVGETVSRHSEENQALLQRLGSAQKQLELLDDVQRAFDEMNAAKP